MGLIKQIYLNVDGLNNAIKRKRIAKVIKIFQAQVVCLQETHIRSKDEKYLKQVFKGQLFHAAASTKMKGDYYWDFFRFKRYSFNSEQG